MLLLAAKVVEKKIACACSLRQSVVKHPTGIPSATVCNSAEFDQKLLVNLDPFGLALKFFVNFDQ